jgi:hypothetical protein
MAVEVGKTQSHGARNAQKTRHVPTFMTPAQFAGDSLRAVLGSVSIMPLHLYRKEFSCLAL